MMIKNYNQFCNESTNYIHLLTPEQIRWCRENLRIWSVNDKGLVDVDGDVKIWFARY